LIGFARVNQNWLIKIFLITDYIEHILY